MPSGRQLLGFLEIGIGFMLLIWGIWLWRNPSKLSSDSWIYKYFLLDWKIGPRRKTDVAQLNIKQLRYYSLRTIASGIFLMVLGMVSLIS